MFTGIRLDYGQDSTPGGELAVLIFLSVLDLVLDRSSDSVGVGADGASIGGTGAYFMAEARTGFTAMLFMIAMPTSTAITEASRLMVVVIAEPADLREAEPEVTRAAEVMAVRAPAPLAVTAAVERPGDTPREEDPASAVEAGMHPVGTAAAGGASCPEN